MKSSRIFVFEWLTGGGLSVDKISPESEKILVEQGQQMLLDVCQDFAECGYSVKACVERRIKIPGLQHFADLVRLGEQPGDMATQLLRQAENCDWILIIAPETRGRLAACLSWLRPIRDRLLNPSLPFTVLTSNKHETAVYLASKQVPTPPGLLLPEFQGSHGQRLTFPCLIKPIDGCGGENLSLVEHPNDITPGRFSRPENFRIEERVDGVPVSVAAIFGKPLTLCPPMRQQISTNPFGQFLDCVDDLAPNIFNRAIRLARETAAAFDERLGYFGIDMIIGDKDYVVEINPRITMSYGRLRNSLKFKLAHQMIAAANRA